MKRLAILLLISVPAVSFACDNPDKIYAPNSNVLNAVYECSDTGQPYTRYKKWICRTDMTEGVDEVQVILPRCYNTKSEYDKLMEQKKEAQK